MVAAVSVDNTVSLGAGFGGIVAVCVGHSGHTLVSGVLGGGSSIRSGMGQLVNVRTRGGGTRVYSFIVRFRDCSRTIGRLYRVLRMSVWIGASNLTKNFGCLVG